MSCAKKSRGSVDCDCGFVRMCFENVQCHVLHHIRISVLHLDCIGQWGSRLCACAIRMLFVLQVFKQFFCEIVTEIVGQRWPRGATRSLWQRLRLSFEAFIS